MVIIPNVVFVFILEDEISLVKQHPLIIKIAKYPGDETIGIIPATDIELLRHMAEGTENLITFTPTLHHIGKRALVKRGVFQGLTGSVERVNSSKSKMYVSVSLLGSAMVEVSSKDLEIIEDLA